MSRQFKQILYGGLFLMVVAIAVLLVYWRAIFVAPTCFDGIQNQSEEGIDCGAVCGISCEQKYLKDLSYSNAKIIQREDSISVYFDLVNLNPHFGLKNFNYDIKVYGFANKLLKTIDGNSFVYPGETKKIAEAGVKILGQAQRAEISFSDVNWQPSSDFRSIKLENVGAKTTREGDNFVISGSIRNLYNFSIPQTVVTGFLRDSAGNILGASKTELGQLENFGEKPYKVYIQVGPGLEDEVDFSASQTLVYSIY